MRSLFHYERVFISLRLVTSIIDNILLKGEFMKHAEEIWTVVRINEIHPSVFGNHR